MSIPAALGYIGRMGAAVLSTGLRIPRTPYIWAARAGERGDHKQINLSKRVTQKSRAANVAFERSPWPNWWTGSNRRQCLIGLHHSLSAHEYTKLIPAAMSRAT